MTDMNRPGRWQRGPSGSGQLKPVPPLTVTAVVLGLGAVGESLARGLGRDGSGQYTLVLILLALATTFPLALPQQTVPAIVVSTASVLSITPFHSLTVAGTAAQLFVLYRLSRSGSTVLAGLMASPFLILALADPAPSEPRVVTVVLAAAAPAAVWAATEQRARQQAQAHSSARHAINDALLEHTALGERARIARELHDVVAHHISMIAVQAEHTRLTTPGMPNSGAQRLSAIGDTARTALTEMRSLLGVLREDADLEGRADRAPQPGFGLRLSQLNDLLDEARDAAQTGVRLILHGPPNVLDPGVELAAYRIIQEALTNARRHAPGAAVDVELHYTTDTLRLRIRDDGPGPPPVTADGNGMLGMRERAVAVGGQLRTGSASGGGFIVESVLPVKTDLVA
jgi:signal transduction histidine kinase